jgi:plastocyanin
MRRLLLLPLALVAALLVATAAGADTKTVQITQGGFTPSATTVTVGDTVTWHNADNATHQVVADDGSFASPILKPDESFSHTFANAGKVTYHDSFARSHKGTVTVNAPAAGVTLSASSMTVTYGSPTHLSGAVSNQLTNEPVTLTSQPFGKGIQSVSTTTTANNGTFGFDVTPSIQTAYQAHWRTASSNTVTINVAPRIGFGRSGRLYIAKVTSDLTYSGHFVWVQRHNSLGGWTNVKRVVLGSSSRAVFTLRLPRGHSTLRLFLPSGQAGAGYVSSMSRMLFVTR